MKKFISLILMILPCSIYAQLVDGFSSNSNSVALQPGTVIFFPIIFILSIINIAILIKALVRVLKNESIDITLKVIYLLVIFIFPFVGSIIVLLILKPEMK